MPNVQLPLPIDHFALPSYPVRRIPYQIANAWESLHLREHADESLSLRQRAQKHHARAQGAASGTAAGEIPRGLRDALKRSAATRTWVAALEGAVRSYAATRHEGWEHVDTVGDESEGADGTDDDEMAIVVADPRVRPSRIADGRLELDDLGSGDAGTYK